MVSSSKGGKNQDTLPRSPVGLRGNLGANLKEM